MGLTQSKIRQDIFNIIQKHISYNSSGSKAKFDIMLANSSLNIADKDLNDELIKNQCSNTEFSSFREGQVSCLILQVLKYIFTTYDNREDRVFVIDSIIDDISKLYTENKKKIYSPKYLYVFNIICFELDTKELINNYLCMFDTYRDDSFYVDNDICESLLEKFYETAPKIEKKIKKAEIKGKKFFATRKRDVETTADNVRLITNIDTEIVEYYPTKIKECATKDLTNDMDYNKRLINVLFNKQTFLTKGFLETKYKLSKMDKFVKYFILFALFVTICVFIGCLYLNNKHFKKMTGSTLKEIDNTFYAKLTGMFIIYLIIIRFFLGKV